MDIRKVKKLIELIQESQVDEIEIKEGEESIRISRYANKIMTSSIAPTTIIPSTPPPATTTPKEITPEKAHEVPEEEGKLVHSPMVGTVYLAPAPGEKPFVEVGQHVKPGDTLCLIEAMKMYNPIEAEYAGVISARLVENAQPVEFDQTLFIISES